MATKKMEKLVSVIDERKYKAVVVGRFDTIAEAEACIRGLWYLDRASVEAGRFGINAPETMVNPTRRTQ
jgi:hypothetical protein